jgi:hypothetical protein
MVKVATVPTTSAIGHSGRHLLRDRDGLRFMVA